MRFDTVGPADSDSHIMHIVMLPSTAGSRIEVSGDERILRHEDH